MIYLSLKNNYTNTYAILKLKEIYLTRFPLK